MTRKKAVECVVSSMRIAVDARKYGRPHEADAADRATARLVARFKITDAEIDAASEADALASRPKRERMGPPTIRVRPPPSYTGAEVDDLDPDPIRQPGISRDRAADFVRAWAEMKAARSASVFKRAASKADPCKQGRRAAQAQHARTNAWMFGCGCEDCAARRDLGDAPSWMKKRS